MATDVKKIAKDYLLAINSHDVNKIVSFWADDGIREDVARGTVIHGKKEIIAFYNSAFADIPDYKGELKSVFGAGDWAVTEYVCSGTHAHAHSSIPGPATGKTVSFRGAEIFQLCNGKISRVLDYYNMTTILQQLGLMPGQPK